MKKRRANSSLGIELDKMWWKANHHKYAWRDEVETFINILCFRLGISPITLSICTIGSVEQCRARNSGKNPCNGACYCRNALGKGIIMVRNLFNFPIETLLHELLHHISNENKNQAISAIMYAWYKEFYGKRTGYRKFIREATKNEGEE